MRFTGTLREQRLERMLDFVKIQWRYLESPDIQDAEWNLLINLKRNAHEKQNLPELLKRTEDIGVSSIRKE